MKRDDLRLLARAAGVRPIAVADVAVRRTVEAVAPHSMSPIPLVGQGVEIRAIGKGVMECRVEHGNLRNAGAKRRSCRLNALQIVGVVQRRELDRFLDATDDVIVDSY